MGLIALVDCDCFFVSCERAENPKLDDKPVCVTSGENGCVVSRSKEAKKLGIKMGEPYFMVQKSHPEVTYLTARHDCYHRYSTKVMATLKEFTPDVEVYSVDEAYVNLHGLDTLYHKSIIELAATIRHQVWQNSRIPVSIGIGPSKTLAKLASDKAKNNGGVYMVEAAQIDELLQNTELAEVCGFGRQNTAKMKMAGIFTCFEFVQNSDSWVRKHLGINGLNLKYELKGIAVNRINPVDEHPKSIQDTSALSKFTTDIAVLRASLKYHAHQASQRLRQEEGYCRVVGVMLRTKEFKVIRDYVKLVEPTNGEQTIFKTAAEILNKLYLRGVVYRSSGIMLENLSYQEDYQPSLFAKPEYSDDKISRVLDELEKKFGKNIVKNGLF